jgi:hypothetical protein
MGHEFFLRKKGNAQAFQRRQNNMRGAVERDLSLDANIQLLAPASEFPDVQAAMRGKAQIDAPISEAARVKLPSRATVTKYSRSFRLRLAMAQFPMNPGKY